MIDAATEGTGDGTVVSFLAEGFSAYAIVEGPSAVPREWNQITTLADFLEAAESGLYVGTSSGYYMTNGMGPGSQDAATTGIFKTKPARNFPPLDAAAKYYFEPVPGTTDQVYAYCYDDQGSPLYVRNTGDANLTLTDVENRTAFTVDIDNNGRFRFYNGNRYWNMWNGANGNHIACWTTANDANNYFYLWQHDDQVTGDPYGLDGTTYGL